MTTTKRYRREAKRHNREQERRRGIVEVTVRVPVSQRETILRIAREMRQPGENHES